MAITYVNETIDEIIKDLLNRAKKDPNKGRYYVYESYKQELNSLDIPPNVYEQTCRKLAQNLKI